jgi:F-type H+-transporting ATPase subunit delta
MPSPTSVKRYAQAVFEIACETDNLTDWQSDLKAIAQLKQDSEFMDLSENPKLPFELKMKLAQAKLNKISPMALNLVYLLLSRNKFKFVDRLAEEYERLLRDYRGVKSAEVTTAVALDPKETQTLSQRLEAIVGKKVIISNRVDPDILGGFIARIDDSLIDGSVRNELETLKKNLAEKARAYP